MTARRHPDRQRRRTAGAEGPRHRRRHEPAGPPDRLLRRDHCCCCRYARTQRKALDHRPAGHRLGTLSHARQHPGPCSGKRLMKPRLRACCAPSGAPDTNCRPPATGSSAPATVWVLPTHGFRHRRLVLPALFHHPVLCNQLLLKGFPMSVYNVLFLCTGNSARSIMAESILNHPRWRSVPCLQRGQPSGWPGQPARHRIAATQPLQNDSLHSKNWREFAQADAPHMNFVLTVCDKAAGEVCPVWPGSADVGALGRARSRRGQW